MIRRNHYVPDFYLKMFASSEGRIHVYDKVRKVERSQSTKDTGVERGLYTVLHEGELVDDIETRLLQPIESATAPILRTLVASGAAVRVGGDEFVILFAAGSEELARAVAERVVAECQTLGLPYAHPGSARRTFSVSAAVSAIDANSAGRLGTLRASMEEAIWRAKRRLGRDFGVVAEEEDHAR